MGMRTCYAYQRLEVHMRMGFLPPHSALARTSICRAEQLVVKILLIQ